MTDDELAFVQWVGKRHKWLSKFAYQRATWLPLRIAACEALALVIRLDLKRWRRQRRLALR
jgi:hypothetical protein